MRTCPPLILTALVLCWSLGAAEKRPEDAEDALARRLVETVARVTEKDIVLL